MEAISRAKLTGRYHIEHSRDGKVIDTFEVDNLVTNEGKNKMLDVMFHSIAAIATWYMGLIDNAGFTAIAAADSHTSHAGWSEFVAYDEATREEWAEDAAASQAISNITLMEFTMNATGSVKGAFLASISTKGSTGAATLWNATAFSSAISVIDNDVLRLTYTVSLT